MEGKAVQSAGDQSRKTPIAPEEFWLYAKNLTTQLALLAKKPQLPSPNRLTETRKFAERLD
jgi:hypothetical protein